jgi:hypothetical protein
VLKARSFVEGAGIGILMLANHLWPVLSPYHIEIYNSPASASLVATGLALDLVLISLFFAVILECLDHYRPQRLGILWAAVLTFAVAKSIDFTVFLLNFYQADISWHFTRKMGLFMVALSAALLLMILSPAAFRKSVRVTRVGLAIFGCSILWMLPQLAYTALRTRSDSISGFVKPLQAPNSSKPRVIWVLMDELSYNQVFGHRYHDVKLPHFDELKNDSVVFSDVQPEGYYTARILPALFLGRKLDNIRSSISGDLEVHDVEQSRWIPFDQEASVFGEAMQSGWTTGVAGWFNPYCHILKDVLDSCYSLYIDPTSPQGSSETSLILDAMDLPFYTPRLHIGGFAVQSKLEVQTHTREYQELTGAADSLIQDESVRFVFLHLPVPHPPGIYDRKTNTLGVKGSYLDNLALADRTLGDLLDVIQKTAAAPRTTLIVSADHSWRVKMWRPERDWTAEEERASGGKFDPRPFLLIHFPGSDAGEVRTEPFPELATTGVIRAMLTGGIDSQGDLDRWLAEHHD